MKTLGVILGILSFVVIPVGFAHAAIGDALAEVAAPGPFPADVAFHKGALWVADWETGALFELDPGTGRVKREVKAPCHHPDGLASDGSVLYVSDPAGRRIFVFDPETEITKYSYGTPEDSPRGLAFGDD